MNVKLITALRLLKEAHEQITEIWCSEVDLNETRAIMHYPYSKSFDELNVPMWCEETIKELSKEISTVLNPKCLKCTNKKLVTTNTAGMKVKPYYICNDMCVDYMYVNFNREELIDELVEDDISREACFSQASVIGNIYRHGITGYYECSDYEIYNYYNERVKMYEEHSGCSINE